MSLVIIEFAARQCIIFNANPSFGQCSANVQLIALIMRIVLARIVKLHNNLTVITILQTLCFFSDFIFCCSFYRIL